MALRSRQTQRDKNAKKNRQEQCGGAFDVMSQKLAPYSKLTLLREAKAFCEKEKMEGREIAMPDRIDRRLRPALITWYCQNYRQVLDGRFTTDVSSMKRRGRRPGHLRVALTIQEPIPTPIFNFRSDEMMNSDDLMWDCEWGCFSSDDDLSIMDF
jgi:hypothetical protein